MSNYAYSNILRSYNVTSGIAEKVYMAPVRWFADGGIKMPDAYATQGDLVRVKQSHEFLSGKAFIKMMLAPEKNSYEARTVGSRETQKYEHTLNVFFPGSYAVLHETLSAMQNEPFIALVQDSACEANMYYQLGDPVDYLWLQSDFTSGTTKDGAKGYTCTFKWVYKSLLIYVGNADITPPDGNFDPNDFLTTTIPVLA